MTSFSDVIQPLLTQLEAMSNAARQSIQTFTQGTTTFRNHTNDVGNLASPIHFMGQGANAFIAAVNHNADLSNKAITRLSDFQEACDDAKTTITDMSTSYDSESLYLNNIEYVSEFANADQYNTYEHQYFLDAQGYSTSDTSDPRTTVVWRIREDTLGGLSSQLDTLLNTYNGQTLLEGNINYAVSCIKSDFQNYQSQRHEFLNGASQNKEISKDQRDYYALIVDSSYNQAMNIVNAIAKNMTNAYNDWDTEFIAAANNFLTKVGDIDSGNLAQFQLDNKIDSEFHDPRTQALLYAMSQCPYGAKVVQYLLNEASSSKKGGDYLVVWQDGMPANTGAFNNGTTITLNVQNFDPNDPNSLVTLAGYITHEAVETYYVQAYGIPADTVPMDYLADFANQIVTQQMAQPPQPPGYYPDYKTWVNDPQNPSNGSDSGYVYVHDFHESNDPGGGFGEQMSHDWWSLWNNSNPNYAKNPMGLSPSLLQNDSTMPGWDISKYWDPKTSTFLPVKPH